MKKVTLFGMALMGAIALQSCGEGKKEKPSQETEPMHDQMDMESGEMQEMRSAEGDLDDGAAGDPVKFTNKKLDPVFQNYQEVKSALVNSDSEEAQRGAKELLEDLKAVQAEQAAVDAAQKIAQAENLNVQRIAFAELSGGVATLLEGEVASGAIYKQHCPMAFEGQGGYWLSNSQDIRNPYYGSKMLKCGSVRDTLE